ncbi:response regulator [Desulfococcus sp.]|uniref:response regulator n=1 Tax=Desulfococcus sp. TaxID=2025834 RepID=UPI0035938723
MAYTDQKILLVDDDTTMLELLRRGLSADQDLYEVVCAKNAQEAIDYLERIHFPMVVADIQMRTMSGLDLLAKIRERWPHVKVILMTGSPSRQLREEIRRTGCLRLFQKPIRIADLRALIAGELAAPGGGEQGFAGRLTNIKLSDLIQMCCVSGISTVIQVRKNRTVGTIFIEEGEIIHADCGETEGLNAFYEIFSWQSGSFETLGDVAVPKTTIDKNWQYLLMEGHRQMDEALASASGTNPLDREEGGDPDAPDLSEDCLKLLPGEMGIEAFQGAEKAVPHPLTAHPPVRVLIVDDSAVMCRVLTDMLASDEAIRVVGTARNGEAALAEIDRVRPDLITLDVNMPVMNGSTALKHIMIRSPCPVVIVSAIDHGSDANILDFLLLGAVDYVQKPVRGADAVRARLIQAVRRAARAETGRFRRAKPPGVVAGKAACGSPLTPRECLVVVCSGAGGYAELVKILPLLPAAFKGALVAVQTMTPSFREPFADYLDRRSHLHVRPSGSGTAMLQGCCYLASGDAVLRLHRHGEGCVLRGYEGNAQIPGSGPPVGLLASAAETFGGRLMVVLLSGAEAGSLSGLREIRRRGGRILSQDLRDCLVPFPLEAALDAGLITASMGIREIASEMVRFSRAGSPGE